MSTLLAVRKSVSRILLIVTLILTMIVSLFYHSPRAHASVPQMPGWTLQFSDDFNGASGTGVDRAKWIYDIGHGYPGGPANWGTGEIEFMTDSTNNVYQDGSGHLVIKAIRDSSGGWTSGRIETQRTDFQPPPGGVMRVEASIRLPNVTGAAAQGYWPAFWMLGEPYRGNYWNWPGIGEIDILENVNGANTVWGTLHCGVSPGGPCNETSGIGGSQSGFSPSLQSAYHRYTIEWDRSVSPEQIRWYVDGSHFHTVNANQVDATTWANATNHGFYIILNLAIGGGWPGNPTSSTASGASMSIDYVAVWTKGGNGGNPGDPPGSSNYGVENVSPTQAKVWYKPPATANYVILHYIRPGLSQQNVYMTYNSSSARWEYTVTGLSPGQVLQYQFTYNTGGTQYDTAWYSYTKP
ncbi:family 16 glycosylhydrolase [Paenactinomyces guangxiensis]|uniref:Family 16 glycosylhydrolase n=1 Tax=Paenactinomyces guangxiensis TaxID=1490290 RepID=A0A7W2A7R9_9BACL|nr:family 16 glycosylhydrolase [Paenactinomyces guangxiensis]MBA4493895.1 family 16 glycosylhydrolase [Paenactinomyces guangxiensis]MBH8591361.1 family 16 glycosylhydrolase [Paenactinomyces guangxiensis]